MMKKYSEEWVMSRPNPNHGLEPIRAVLKKFNNPQNEIRCIHIAGTNGKGSTTNYLKEILVSQGYRVGMFTSPHIITHRDRIRINDTFIDAETYQKYLLEMKDDIETYDLGMFEIVTVIAFRYFKDQNVDYALIETGLGGRLDNTNVIEKPVLEIITTIDFDHMNILGDRIEQIAFEKAGIIMPHTVCVTSRLAKNVFHIMQRKAMRVNASVSMCPLIRNTGGNTFVFDGDEYTLQTLADYQKYNCALSLYAAKMLGMNIHCEAVKEAVKNAQWIARFEVMNEKPLVIIDGAHNEEGIRTLRESMKKLPHPITVVFSALRDKQVSAMTSLLKDECERMIVTVFENKRADSLEHMKITGCEAEENWKNAIEKAIHECDENGSVVVTGSLYFISLVREYLKKI